MFRAPGSKCRCPQCAIVGDISQNRVALPKPLVILHRGPINRGVEITSEVADHPQAIILDQVLNGVASRMALLYLLAGKPAAAA
jgi:aspartate carbamoyltransferase catalytic subunit